LRDGYSWEGKAWPNIEELRFFFLIMTLVKIDWTAKCKIRQYIEVNISYT
jgi:hypothetical protein